MGELAVFLEGADPNRGGAAVAEKGPAVVATTGRRHGCLMIRDEPPPEPAGRGASRFSPASPQNVAPCDIISDLT